MTATKNPSGDPPSPSTSYYDVSDDEEGEYNTIAHSNSGKGVKLLFSKSKVRVPARFKSPLRRLLNDRPLGILTLFTGLRPSHTIIQ
jgi:hypothetical protein